MKNLILKDFRVLAIFNMIMPLAWIFLGYSVKQMGDTFFAKILFGTYIFMFIYLIPLLLTKNDANVNIDIILNSLPIDSKDIVRARYISILLYTIIISLGFFIAYNMTSTIYSEIIGSITMKISNLLFLMGLSLIILSLYLPFHYSSIRKAQTFNQFFYITLFFIQVITLKYSEKILSIDKIKYIVNMDSNKFVPVFIGFGIVLYLLSLQLSKSIYKRKEF